MIKEPDLDRPIDEADIETMPLVDLLILLNRKPKRAVKKLIKARLKGYDKAIIEKTKKSINAK